MLVKGKARKTRKRHSREIKALKDIFDKLKKERGKLSIELYQAVSEYQAEKCI